MWEGGRGARPCTPSTSVRPAPRFPCAHFSWLKDRLHTTRRCPCACELAGQSVGHTEETFRQTPPTFPCGFVHPLRGLPLIYSSSLKKKRFRCRATHSCAAVWTGQFMQPSEPRVAFLVQRYLAASTLSGGSHVLLYKTSNKQTDRDKLLMVRTMSICPRDTSEASRALLDSVDEQSRGL